MAPWNSSGPFSKPVPLKSPFLITRPPLGFGAPSGHPFSPPFPLRTPCKSLLVWFIGNHVSPSMCCLSCQNWCRQKKKMFCCLASNTELVHFGALCRWCCLRRVVFVVVVGGGHDDDDDDDDNTAAATATATATADDDDTTFKRRTSVKLALHRLALHRRPFRPTARTSSWRRRH